MFAEYAQGMDLILRYENIESDLKDTFGNAGIPWKADIPIVNRTAETDRATIAFVIRHLQGLLWAVPLQMT